MSGPLTVFFRDDYRFNGRRETVNFGSYGPAGLSLAKLAPDQRKPNGQFVAPPGRGEDLPVKRFRRGPVTAEMWIKSGSKPPIPGRISCVRS